MTNIFWLASDFVLHVFRHLALANQPQEASFFSVQLVQQGFLSTSPIHLSLLEARKFAWRTRIVSSQGELYPDSFCNLLGHVLDKVRYCLLFAYNNCRMSY